MSRRVRWSEGNWVQPIRRPVYSLPFVYNRIEDIPQELLERTAVSDRARRRLLIEIIRRNQPQPQPQQQQARTQPQPQPQPQQLSQNL
ncbi:MAG: hypothetical protein QXT27_01590, partial [Pyrobaculum sp.]